MTEIVYETLPLIIFTAWHVVQLLLQQCCL
jgi:hypothetical protein